MSKMTRTRILPHCLWDIHAYMNSPCACTKFYSLLLIFVNLITGPARRPQKREEEQYYCVFSPHTRTPFGSSGPRRHWSLRPRSCPCVSSVRLGFREPFCPITSTAPWGPGQGSLPVTMELCLRFLYFTSRAPGSQPPQTFLARGGKYKWRISILCQASRGAMFLPGHWRATQFCWARQAEHWVVPGHSQLKLCPSHPYVSFRTQGLPPSTQCWVSQGSRFETKYGLDRTAWSGLLLPTEPRSCPAGSGLRTCFRPLVPPTVRVLSENSPGCDSGRLAPETL